MNNYTIIPEFFTSEECVDIVSRYKKKFGQAFEYHRVKRYDGTKNCFQELVLDNDISELFQKKLEEHDVVPELKWKLYERLRIVHYDVGQGIPRHTDAIFQERHMQTKYTCFVYLTEGHGGGATRIWNPDGTTTDIVPEIGTALFFPISETPHAGMPLTSGPEKMIVISKIMTTS